MAKLRTKGEKIRHYILSNLKDHPQDIASVTAKHFNITRQAVNKHLQKLIAESALKEDGRTRSKTYYLVPQYTWEKPYKITADLAEDFVWRNDIRPILGILPENVIDIWHYGFTEMFNNAIDHSEGTIISVHVIKTAVDTEMYIIDDGIGIFKKIQQNLNLLDERQALFELSKGKLTTDPKHHTGEGIFFTSRMFDSYCIVSDGVSFSHNFDKPEDWLFENEKMVQGTSVIMQLNNHTARSTKKIFLQYAPKDEYLFNKTVVPVKLAQYGNDKLISRSQAKRLLTRVELFKIVILDFKEVDVIGQAFADEIFRVFAHQHPRIQLIVMNANAEVNRMIKRAKRHSEYYA